MSEFDEYIVHGEPGQKEKADAWQTAIGLQNADGPKASTYLLATARQHIEDDIFIDKPNLDFYIDTVMDTNQKYNTIKE